MRNSKLTNERGMALAVAIFALVVIGALVAGAFYASTLEQRTGLVRTLAVLAVVAALATSVQTYRVGDSGARAAWGDKVSSSANK